MRKKERIQKIIKWLIIGFLLLGILLIGLNYKKIISFTTTKLEEISSNFYISFDKILGDEPVIEEKQEKPIKGIDLISDDTITYKDAMSYQKGLETFFTKAGEKNHYYDSFSDVKKYHQPLKDQLSGTYYSDIINDKKEPVLINVFNNIYKNEYVFYHKVSLVGFGKTTKNTYLDAEIVAVGDTEHFFTQTVRLILDKYHRINDIQLIKPYEEVENTTAPITKESILYDSHKDFLNLWDNIVSNLTNKEVYEEYKKGETSEVTYKINTMIENVKLENKDVEVLKKLFLAGKGTFENYGFTEYYVEDKEMNALTTYTIKFSENTFQIIYNRLTNQILNILISVD